MSGKETVWDRLTKGRKQQREEPVPTDKKGAELYTAFQDCLDQHKRHILYGEARSSAP